MFGEGEIKGEWYIKPTATSRTLSCKAKSVKPSQIPRTPPTTRSLAWWRSSPLSSRRIGMIVVSEAAAIDQEGTVIITKGLVVYE